MKLSILIPAYNPGKYLRKILDTLALSIDRYPETEIIVIDDGSTEDLSWAANYSNVRYIRKDNEGEPRARNDLLRAATGEYIQFIDSDDEIYSNCLDVIYDNISKGFDFVTYEHDTDHDRKRSYHNHGMLMYNCALWGYTFRRAFVDGVMFDESYLPDTDVHWLPLVLREDAKHWNDDRVWYNYRWDDNYNSLSHQKLRGEI